MFEDEDYSDISDNGIVFKAAMFLLAKMNKGSERLVGEEIAKIIQHHSIGASIAVVLSTWMPDILYDIVLIVGLGLIWSMFYRINSHLGIPFTKNLIKSIVTIVFTTVVANFVGDLVFGIFFSFLPEGVGFIFESIIAGIVFYILYIATGIFYLKVLAIMAEEGNYS